MAAISSRDLTRFPDVSDLRLLLQSMAMLDAILSPDWESRYYSFNSNWASGQMLGSMRDGLGNDFFALFNSYGCFFKGFVHDCPAAGWNDPAEYYKPLPAEFASCVKEPAFTVDEVTFCLWRTCDSPHWSQSEIALPPGTDPDGSASLLSILDGDPQSYREWVEDYYEAEIPLEPVKAIYEHKPLSKSIVAALNEDVQLRDLKDDIREIGYPSANP